MQKTFESKSKEETQKLGVLLCKYLEPGNIILINGDLGAGKSELVRGIGVGLGINCAIPSPTFTILNAYENVKVPLYHFDWYRVTSEDELYEIGIEDFLFSNGISCIEWSELFKDFINSFPHLDINIKSSCKNENIRYISISTDNFNKSIDLEEVYNEYISI